MIKHDSVSVFLYRQFAIGDFRLLLLLHEKFGKWIVPGGHVEDFEHQLEAAIREVKEETGIELVHDNFIQLNRYHQFPSVPGVLQVTTPLFIFEQIIPEYKGQPSHFHIDHVYCATAKQMELSPGVSESKKIGWYTEDDIRSLDMFQSNQDVAQYLFSLIRNGKQKNSYREVR